jgi:2-polyprenylphenol 6-hydroxylase
MPHEFDIIILGGGMVGSTLAMALDQQRWRIAIVDPLPSPPPAIASSGGNFANRVSAITRATEIVWRNLGIWPTIACHGAWPYRAMEVWEDEAKIHFDAAAIGEPDLGHIIENRLIVSALWQQLAERDNVTPFLATTPISLSQSGDRHQITLGDGSEITGRLLAGCDGARSWLRQQMAIETVEWSYQQSAVVATIHSQRDHQQTALQRFTPEGPIALLPLAPHYTSLVWSVRPDHATTLLALDDTAFLAELQQAFGDRLGTLDGCGERGAWPLILQHARSYTAPRVVLAGNAAHAIHPLAGQGLNLGIADVATLADLLNTAGPRHDPGDIALLRRYERWRKGENLAVMAAMDGFKRLFGNAHPLLGAARRLAIRASDRLTPLKEMAMRRALGVSGDLPPLARRSL